MSYLSAVSSIIVLKDQGGYFAFDRRTDELMRLNETAAIVFDLADGTRSRDDILRILLKRVGHDKTEKCRKWIDKAIASGTLVEQPSAVPVTPCDPHELHALAGRLLAAGEVRSAYLVQKRAIELLNDDPAIWNQLGELAQIMGYRDEARQAYERYFEHHPDDAGMAYILSAMRGEPPPQRASNAYIKHLYQGFSGFYNQNMCEELAYKAPERLLAAIKPLIQGQNSNAIKVADLGCGTGLFGRQIRSFCGRLVGVDLSPEMLQIAESQNAYDQLICDEITCWLVRKPVEQFDLIVFSDTLIYFGDLGPVMPACQKHLKPGGYVAFTLEKGDVSPFKLSDSGRFQHHRNHVRDVAKATGFEIVHRSETILRMEHGKEVAGLVTIFQMKWDRNCNKKL